MKPEFKDAVAAKLEAIGAMAKSLAFDVEKGRLWEGDFERRLGAIQAEVTDCRNMSEYK